MAVLKKIVVVLVGIVIVVVIIGLLLPSKLHVERSITINAPRQAVFDFVNDVEKNQLWSPWKERDTTIKTTFGELKKGKDAWYSWTSKNSGSGKLTITNSIQDSLVETFIDFEEMGKATGGHRFKVVQDKVNVTQFFDEDMGYNIIGRYISMFLKGALEKDFDQGLSNLKRVSEESNKIK